LVPLGISELPSPPFRVHYIIYMYCREGAVVFREGDKTVYFFIILCFLSLSFGERYSVDLEAY